MCVEGYHRIRPLRRFCAHCWNERNVSMFVVWCFGDPWVVAGSNIQRIIVVIWFRNLEVLLCVLLDSFRTGLFELRPLYVFLLLIHYVFHIALYAIRWSGIKHWVTATLFCWLPLSSMTASNAPTLAITTTVSLSIDNMFSDASNLAYSFPFRWTYGVPCQFQI